jgi:hypothetical protein
MESSSVVVESREPSAKDSGEASLALPEAPTVKDADEALLEICKEISAAFQKLELHLTSRSQAAGMSATSNANTVHTAMNEQEVVSLCT